MQLKYIGSIFMCYADKKKICQYYYKIFISGNNYRMHILAQCSAILVRIDSIAV